MTGESCNHKKTVQESDTDVEYIVSPTAQYLDHGYLKVPQTIVSELALIHLCVILGKSFLLLSLRHSLHLDLLECALPACSCLGFLAYLHRLILLFVLNFMIGISLGAFMIYLSILLGILQQLVVTGSDNVVLLTVKIYLIFARIALR